MQLNIKYVNPCTNNLIGSWKIFQNTFFEEAQTENAETVNNYINKQVISHVILTSTKKLIF